MTATLTVPQVMIESMPGQSAPGAREVSVAGARLADVLGDVRHRYPELAARLTDDEGRLHRFLNVYIDDIDVRSLGGLDAPVRDGARLLVVPAVAGG